MLVQAINAISETNHKFNIFHARTLSALGRHDEALDELEVVEHEVWNDQELQAAVLIDKASFRRRLGEATRADEIISDYQKAYGIYEKLIAETRDQEERERFIDNQGSCLFNEGAILQYFLNSPESALDRYQKALELFKKVEDADGIGTSWKQMGEIYGNKLFKEFYNIERAVEWLTRALGVFEENNLQNRKLEAFYELGRITRSNPERSLQVFQQYLIIARELGLIREEAIAQRYIAEFEFLIFKNRVSTDVRPPSNTEAKEIYERTARTLNQSVNVLNGIKFDLWSRRELANCYYLLGRLLLDQENTGEALKYFNHSLDVTNEPVFRHRIRGDVRRRVKALAQIMQILLSSNENQKVGVLFDQFRADFDLFRNSYPDQKIGEILDRLEAEE